MDAMTYQQSREKLLKQLEDLKSVYNDLSSSYPFFGNELPSDTARRLQFIDRDIVRLRNRDLVIAFVGGFSAGKSSLLNAFLGRYLLPESTEITTAVPTYVRCGSDNEYAEIHYLSNEETSELDGLYRSEIAEAFNMPELQNASVQDILKKARPLATDATGSWLIKNLESLAKQKSTNPNFPSKRTVSIQEMQGIVRDEAQAMFIDHVEVNVKSSQLPSDIVLVDLPGVSVPNPRHRQATFKFIESAHAVVFVLLATRLFDLDESKVMERICAGETRIVDKTFWVLNRWDALTLSQQELTRKDFKATMEKFSIQGYRYYTTNALYGLLSQLRMRGETSLEDDNLARHLRDYEQSQSAKSNETVLEESQILDLREAVLSFVNQKIRDMTLEIARENTEQNFCQPILYHLRLHKQSDDSLLGCQLPGYTDPGMFTIVGHRSSGIVLHPLPPILIHGLPGIVIHSLPPMLIHRSSGAVIQCG